MNKYGLEILKFFGVCVIYYLVLVGSSLLMGGYRLEIALSRVNDFLYHRYVLIVVLIILIIFIYILKKYQRGWLGRFLIVAPAVALLTGVLTLFIFRVAFS